MTTFYESIFSFPANQIHGVNRYEYVVVSDYNDLLDKDYFRHFLNKAKTNRVNFFSQDMYQILYKLEESSQNTYSWFVLMREQEKLKTSGTFVLPSHITLKICDSDEISIPDREKIIQAWKNQYVDVIHLDKNFQQKERCFSSIQQTLQEGTHLLYYVNDILFAHMNYVEDFNEILQNNNYYIHRWIDQNQPSHLRSTVLTHFFNYTEQLSRPLSAGVSIHNVKALRTLERANFRPTMLSIRIY